MLNDPDNDTLQTIESKVNFRAVEAACEQRGVSVEQYLHEYAIHLFDVYIKWKAKTRIDPQTVGAIRYPRWPNTED